MFLDRLLFRGTVTMLMCERGGLYKVSFLKFVRLIGVPKVLIYSQSDFSLFIQYKSAFLCLQTKVDALVSFGTNFCFSKGIHSNSPIFV